MAKIAGTACVVKVGNAASATTYALLEGQTECSFDGSTNVADTTDKNNSGWQTGVPTTINGAVSCSGKLEDTRTELDKLEAAWLARTAHDCQIVFDAAGNGYQAAFYVTQFNISAPVSDVVTYSITLTPAEALSAIP